MPCDTQLKVGQTIQQRATEIRAVMDRVIAGIKSGRIKAVVGPTRSIAFDGITAQERDGVTDACIYRRIGKSGSAQAMQAIAKAEMLAGRTVDPRMVTHGHHSHDGGHTWHTHKG